MAFGADRTVKVNLRADVSDYLGKMAAAGKATQDFSQAAVRHADKHRASWDRVGKGMAVAGGVIALGVGAAVKAFADFDKQMSQVRAVSGANTAQMKQLSDAALKAGADTKFSASEAATAEAELAKVGISTADILGGALTGSLNLAAAGNLDLGRAAEISGQAMKIFNLEGKDVGHIADVLASGANKSAADVDTLAQALSQSGLVAAQTGMHLEDTVGVLSAFADNALMGSDAGTSLKAMLMRLTPQSQEAAKTMEGLGFSAYDANGSFVGMQEVAGRLQKSMAGLSVEQRNAAMNTIFGSDAVRAANILFRIGAKGVAEYTRGVNDVGAAQRVASVNMDNLSGDIEQFKGSVETGLIRAGAGANDALRSIVKTSTDLVNAFAKLPDGVQKGTVIVGGIGAVALIATAGVMKLVTGAAAAKIALRELGVSAGVSKGQLAGIGVGAAKASAALGALMLAGQALGGNNTGVNKATESLDAYLRSGKDAAGVTSEMAYGFNNLGSAVGYATKGGQIEGLTRSLGDLTGLGNGPQKFFREIDTALAQFVKTGREGDAKKVFDQIAESADRQGISLARVYDALPLYSVAMNDATEAGKKSANAAVTTASGFNGVGKSAEETAKAVQGFSDRLKRLQSIAFGTEDAADSFRSALNDLSQAAKENGRSVKGNSDKAIANRSALRAAAGAALEALDAYAKNGATTAQVTKKAAEYKSALYHQARQAGFSKEAARKYSDVLAKVPAAVRTSFSTPGMGAARASVKHLRDAILAIPNRRVSVSVAVGTANKIEAMGRKAFSTGGRVFGPGTGTSDDIPAWLSNGEYVHTAAAHRMYGSRFMAAVNTLRFPPELAAAFAGGGAVNAVTVRGSTSGSAGAALAAVSPALTTAARAAQAAAVPGGGSQAGLVALGRWFQAHGARVSEHQRFGGVHPVHVPGSAHYARPASRAIDVNYGPGGAGAAEMAFFDRMAPAVRGKGFKVLWRVPGHYNHLHAAYARGGPAGRPSGVASTFRDEVAARRFASGGLVRRAVEAPRQQVVRQVTFTGPITSPDVDQLAGKVAQRMREDEALFPTY